MQACLLSEADRRFPLAATAAAAVVLLVGSAHAQDPEQAYKAAGAWASRPLATVAYGSDPLQVADLRVPSGEGPCPLAIILHGGCFMASVDNRSSIAALADALGKEGFAT